MKRLLAASITLGMLVCPTMSMAQPEATGNNVVPVDETAMVSDPLMMETTDTPQVVANEPQALDVGVGFDDNDLAGTQVAQEVFTCPPAMVTTPVATTTPVFYEQPALWPVEDVVLWDASIPGGTPLVVPYGEDGLPLHTRPGLAAITLADGTIAVACPGGDCPIQETLMGVSAETIEQRTFLTVNRLEQMPDGWVLVTYSTPFMPNEVLIINEENAPELMMLTEGGNLVPHPTYTAAVHNEGIYLIDNAVDLDDLQDNPFPVSTFNIHYNHHIGGAFERPVAFGPEFVNAPITEDAFDRPLPTSVSVAYTGVSPTGEIEVGLPVSQTGMVMPGWRGVVVGGSLLIVDERGVIQDILPLAIVN